MVRLKRRSDLSFPKLDLQYLTNGDIIKDSFILELSSRLQHINILVLQINDPWFQGCYLVLDGHDLPYPCLPLLWQY